MGYKVLYTGTPGAVLEQTGLPQLPVENVMLRKGWNWIGHAPLSTYLIDEIAPVVGSFSADDQLKTRAGTSLKVGTCTGHISGGGAQWAGDLVQLTPGIGYEFKVTFCYGVAGGHLLLWSPLWDDQLVSLCSSARDRMMSR